MAKGGEPKVHVRVKKPRTLAQQERDNAKKERNVALAAQRLAELQARQKQEVYVRQHRQFLTEKARRADEAVTKARQEAARQEAINAFKRSVEDRYVRDALHGPSAKALTKWLAGREATFERVERFFKERPHLVAPSGLVGLPASSRVA